MRNRLRLTPLVLVVLTLLLTAVALGCAAATPTPTPRPTPTVAAPVATPTPTATPTPSAPQPQYGGVFRALTQVDPKSCDYATVSGRTSYEHNVCAGLLNHFVRYGLTAAQGHTTVFPELATAWESNEVGDVWTLTLRQGVRFSNGREFTAEDAKFTFDRLKESPSVGRLGAMRDRVESTEIIDNFTIRVNLKAPWGGFVGQLANPAMYVYPVEPTTDIQFAWADPLLTVGSGAFTLVLAERRSRYIAESRDDYWQEGLPYLDGYEVIVIPDQSARTAAMETAAADSNGANPWASSAFLYLKELPFINSSVQLGARGAGLHMSLQVEPFQNPLVRKAVYMVIDGNESNQVMDEGVGVVSQSIIGVANPATTPIEDQRNWVGWADTPEERAQLREEARQILADAGYPDGFDITADYGKRCLYDQRGHTTTLTQYFTQVLEQYLNIRCELQQVENAIYVDEVHAAHNYGVTGANFGRPDISIDGTLFGQWSCEAGDNKAGDCDPTLEDYVNRIAVELDEQRRVELVREFEDWYHNVHFGPNILVHESPFFIQWNKRVQGYDPGPGRYHVANFYREHLWIDPAIDPLTGERR